MRIALKVKDKKQALLLKKINDSINKKRARTSDRSDERNAELKKTLMDIYNKNRNASKVLNYPSQAYRKTVYDLGQLFVNIVDNDISLDGIKSTLEDIEKGLKYLDDMYKNTKRFIDIFSNVCKRLDEYSGLRW